MAYEATKQVDYDTIERELQNKESGILRIGHNEKDVSDIVSELEKFSNKHFDEATVSEIKLASMEAVRNAYKHGNREDEKKSYNVEAYYYDSKLVISVEDGGEGFDPDSVANPLSAENIEEADGRGLLLMKHYMDQVIHNPKGNIVIMVKNKKEQK